ncbi:type III secretion system (T3SS) inner membrane Yop/YscD-like protein [Stackebrandtia albiflava]|uniref:Type III secretion system (T3SS) inner membrane Yop/YscD-like protein n=1 Tax=Stackebrandtia albiflava TaxID=406432 RepID=A0A562V0X5_9ACTN|nr:FHA domain-containing protein [Stackebrandtia albiflava]TWJ11524.1 type III secretion system (T3SS) inner membrane Yop/YscD-like protein [Stackebrandtia albiflava]
MPELVFTVARFGLLILLWVFVFVVARAIRRDVFARPGGGVAVASRGAAATPPPRGAPGAPAPQAARYLIVTEGDRKGTRLSLGGSTIRIGRSPDSTLVINDDFASARHAQLMPRGGQWLVEDSGSTNGTYLGRAKVTGPTPVPLGVPIRIGRTSIELRP